MKVIKKIVSMIMILLSVVKIDAEDKQQIHFNNNAKSDVVVNLTWRQVDKLHTRRPQTLTVKKGETITVKAPISSYKLEKLSAQTADMVAAEAVVAVGTAGAGIGTIGFAAVPTLVLAAGSAVEGEMLTSYGSAQAHHYTYFTFENSPKSDSNGMKKLEVLIISSTKPLDQISKEDQKNNNSSVVHIPVDHADKKPKKDTIASVLNKTTAAVSSEIINVIDDSSGPVTIFNPLTNAQLQEKIGVMNQDELQAEIVRLDTDILSMNQKIKTVTKRIDKLVVESGMPGAIVGGTIGAAAGIVLAAGTEFVSGGTLTPQACGLAVGGAVVGSATGGAISADLIDGNKIKHCNLEIEQYTKQLASDCTEKVLIQALTVSGKKLAEIQALTQEQIKALPADVLLAIIPSMTPAQIAEVSPKYFSLLSNHQITALTPEQIAAVNPKCLAALTPNISPEQVAAINMATKNFWDSLKSCKDKNNKYNSKKMKAAAEKLVPIIKQIESYLVEALKDVTFMQTAQIIALSKKQIGALTKEQIVELSPLQIQVLAPSQFAAINPYVVKYMTDAQIACINPFQLVAMTKAQKAHFTADQLAAFTLMQVAQQIIGFLLTPAYCFGGPLGA